MAALRAVGPSRPVTGVAEVHEAVLRRVDGGVWRLPVFATNGDRRLFKQQVAVYELIRTSALFRPAAWSLECSARRRGWRCRTRRSGGGW